MTTKITVQQLRSRFPLPRRSKESPLDFADYCVGGALVQQLFDLELFGRQELFPGVSLLAEALTKANPALDFDTAYCCASNITYYNDSGDFSEAWDSLAEALDYSPQNN